MIFNGNLEVRKNIGSQHPCVPPAFLEETGPTKCTKRAKTPVDVLVLFLTVSLLQSIVKQTKIFACQTKVDFDLHYEELLAYLGISIAMGLLRFPSVSDYWTTTTVLFTPWFPATMARDRFFSISRHLHL